MDVFPIAPASAKPLWILAAVCATVALVVVALAYTAWSSRNSRLEVHVDRLRLAGDFWGRTIAIDRLRLGEARIVDLADTPELRPRRRTLGTGLPGYASGWFRLHDGSKALAYLTDRSRVLWLPTDDAFGLLLSVEEPERLLEALAARAPS